MYIKGDLCPEPVRWSIPDPGAVFVIDRFRFASRLNPHPPPLASHVPPTPHLLSFSIRFSQSNCLNYDLCDEMMVMMKPMKNNHRIHSITPITVQYIIPPPVLNLELGEAGPPARSGCGGGILSSLKNQIASGTNRPFHPKTGWIPR